MTPKRQHHAGFTMVELLVAIGVIAVLAGILVAAVAGIRNSMKSRGTRAALENAMGLQTEYESSAGGKKVNDVTGGAFVRADQMAFATVQDGRDGHAIYTQRAMRMIRSLPNAKKSLEAMAASSVAPADAFWVAPGPVEPPASPFRATAVLFVYQVGDVVKWSSSGNGPYKYYRCIVNHRNDAGNPGDTSKWTDLGANNPDVVQVPVDGWSNPIRFVGSAGMSYMTIDPSGDRQWIGPNDSNAMPPPEPPKPLFTFYKTSYKSSTGTSYWVSAGADGDFATHDDNVYSFEN